MSAYDELMSRQSLLEVSERRGPMEKQSMALLRSLGSKIGELIASHPKTIAGLSATGAVGQFAKNYQQDSAIDDLVKETEVLKNLLDEAKASQPEPVPLEMDKAASSGLPIHDLVGGYRRASRMAGHNIGGDSNEGSSPSLWQRVKGFFSDLSKPEHTVSTILPTYRARDGRIKLGRPSSMEDIYAGPAGPSFHADPNGILALQELLQGKNKGWQQPQQGGNGSGNPSWYDELFGGPKVNGPLNSPRSGQGWMGGVPDKYGPGWQDGAKPGYRPIVGRTRGGMDPRLIAGVSPWFQSPTQAQPYSGSPSWQELTRRGYHLL